MQMECTCSRFLQPGALLSIAENRTRQALQMNPTGPSSLPGNLGIKRHFAQYVVSYSVTVADPPEPVHEDQGIRAWSLLTKKTV